MTTPTVEIFLVADPTAVQVLTSGSPVVEILQGNSSILSLAAAVPLTIDVLQQIGPVGPVSIVPGPQGTVGPIGPTGLTGPPGSVGAISTLYFSQQTSSASWTFTHGLVYKPDVEIYDNAGNPIIADVSFPSLTTVQIDWAFPTTGSVRLI